MKHFIKILLGILIIAGVCYGLSTFREQQAPEPEPEIVRPVRTIRLQGGRDSFTRRYFGTVQGSKRADLSFRVSGTLSSINAEKGASVKRGSLLAALDPRDFNTRISQAQSALSQAQAQHKNAETDFRRYENLYKQKVIAKAQYDSVKTQLDVTQSAVNSAQANLKSARDALRDTELRAPFTGLITDRTVENFQDVTAKQTIFVLQDISTLEIVFNVPDNDVLLAPVPQVRNLQDLRKHTDAITLNARFEAMPDKVFPLAIKEISPQATAANTYPVSATMPKQDDIRILPGMAVTVEADFSGGNEAVKNDAAYFVPVTAIRNENGSNYVWRYAVGRVSRVPVQVGQLRNDGTVEINSETLSNGDVIVTAGVYFLHEGQRVRLQEEQL
ncbi:MAG: efflux RND transporter periplasmic adaptor subunit [Synergistaceae bacterium]|nr:efflux RND transporter periplasmic adaptor subunit [Synergistaceae bacterium]